ncbi:MAG: peptidoglycan peptidase [Bacteroidetes bacterium]|jgi:hypothetical protein|nr:peptidoglycan peptidase [Bacteroidota bacterium]
MKLFTTLFTFTCLSFSNTCFSQEISENNWQNGDIVFIRNPKMVSATATTDKNKFNCAGIIFKENGHAMVYYAGDPLKKCQISEFIAMSEDKKYSVKWLMESALLTEEAINSMHTFATAKLGTPYDVKENLNSDEFYNAEFIWKIYRSGLGVHVCDPKEIGTDKKIASSEGMSGSNFANKYVSVRDIYRSELLE